MNKTLLRAAVAAALIAPLGSMAAEPADLASLQQMIEQMRSEHAQQIRALEARIERAEARANTTDETVGGVQDKVAAVEERVEAKPRTGDNSFNPAISLVLQGGLTTYSQNPEDFHLEGMPIGGEAGLTDEGLSLWETELTASANIDNLFYGQTTIGLHTHDGAIEVDLEEAFVDTLSFPAGLGLRFGRFYSSIGYLNEHHTHAWDFADAPLSYQAFLGGQYRDDGVRMSWIAPTDALMIELGAEALRGDAYPGGGNNSDFGAVSNLFAKIGGDIGQHSSWQLGLSRLAVDAAGRSAGGHAHDGGGDSPVFSGDSDLAVFDAVWKTDLGGERALIFQGEYLNRDEDGLATLSKGAGDAQFNYDGKQQGWYLQGLYQINRRWRAGLHYDRLTADNDLTMVSNTTGEADDDIFEESGFQSGGHDPHRWAAMVDWSPSEFSRLRLQYAQDDSRDKTDHQMFLQYIMTLGAHGAHRY